MSNRLTKEKSPYLLQHANNPVDWYPWCPEAFEKAQREDKPILLSSGYSTCHWCHVMERESFEDRETADYLNRHFVAIKLDREERPDIDQFYMRALQAQGVAGGWPLTMFLLPDRSPITGGTYFPPIPAVGRPSFRQVLERIQSLWQEDREKMTDSARILIEYLQEENQGAVGSDSGTTAGKGGAGGQAGESDGVPGVDVLRTMRQDYVRSFDREQGGFLNSNVKFPPSMALLLILQIFEREKGDDLLEMVEITADHILRGGINDQLGGGIARYATDLEWHIPHFEKMLYDNALFSQVLAETYRLTGNERYRHAALEIFRYVDQWLTSPAGGFFSAEDADSEGEEGKFYVWEKSEFDAALAVAGFSTAEIERLALFWGVEERGSFEGRNVLRRPLSDDEFVRRSGLQGEEWEPLPARAKEALLASRERRVRPRRDDKILVSWNALMISALARAARAFDLPEPGLRAVRAADFIWREMREPDGRLRRRYREGEARFRGNLVDYAQFGCALVDLYRFDFNPLWLERAGEMADRIFEHFAAADGRYNDSERAAEDLPLPVTADQEGAEPTGNSAAARLFLSLSFYGVKSDRHNQAASDIFRRFARNLTEYGATLPYMLGSLHLHHHRPPQVVAIFGSPADRERDAERDAERERERDADRESQVRRLLNRELSPDAAVALVRATDLAAALPIIPLLEHREGGAEATAIYYCHDFRCLRPVTTAGELAGLLQLERESG